MLDDIFLERSDIFSGREGRCGGGQSRLAGFKKLMSDAKNEPYPAGRFHFTSAKHTDLEIS